MVIIFSACGNDTQTHIQQTGEAEPNQNDLHQDLEKTTQQLREDARLKILEDFDYLIEEINTNMPLSGVISRKLKIDYSAHFDKIRDELATTDRFGKNATNSEEMEKAAAEYLFSQLHTQVERKLRDIGHLRPKSREMYVDYLYDIMRVHEEGVYNDDPMHIELLETFTAPKAMKFYGVDENTVDIDDISIGVSSSNDSRAAETKIHTQGEIAWITIRHFFNEWDFDRNILFPFYEEIQDYPHLVIDLRGNRGGSTSHFFELIMKPLLTKPTQGTGQHRFYMNGSHASRFIDLVKSHINEQSEDGDVVVRLYNAAEYVSMNNMDEFNEQDLNKLTYAVEITEVMYPMEDGFPFHGKIWILTDHNTASAAEGAVMWSMSTDFATVVGTPTAGIMPGETAHILLPNTGIIFRMDLRYYTDHRGRSLEEFGITPDILNRPRQNAMQTVLELIKEYNMQ
jgi:hypothetical protein